MSLKKSLTAIVVSLVAVLSLFAGVAFAENDALDIASLSNRYEELGMSQEAVDGTDNVVVATRIGVLTGANRALDGATVSFTGEVVGDVMAGGEGYKWLNLLATDGSCVGVWVTDDMAGRVLNKGSYSTTGTTLQVRGIYSIDCATHQGELDVHAIDIRVIDAGGAISHYVDENDFLLSLQLCGIGLLLLAIFVALRWWSDRRDMGVDDSD